MKIVKKIFAKKSIYTNYTENTKKNLLDNSNFEDNCTAAKEQATICNKKFSKIVCSFGLAALLGAMALFGAACTPNSAATSGPQGTQSAAGGSASTGSSTSPFNLNPETDPVLFTTQSGIDIKFGGATVESGALTGYTYFQMGIYNNEPVNWVIIGYNGSTILPNQLISQNMKAWYYNDCDNSYIDFLLNNSGPAGESILLDTNKAEIVKEMIFGTITKAVLNNTELNDGEYLCISEDILGTSIFGSNNDYGDANCSLRIYLENLFNTNLGLTPSEKALFQPKTLGTATTLNNAYLFPVADWDEPPFALNDYLNTYPLKAASAAYWLRNPDSGGWCNVITTSGHTTYAGSDDNAQGVRPAFVMKLI